MQRTTEKGSRGWFSTAEGSIIEYRSTWAAGLPSSPSPLVLIPMPQQTTTALTFGIAARRWSRKGDRMRLLAVSLMVGLAVVAPATAVGQADASPAEMSTEVTDSARDDLFELTISTPRATWAVGEPVEVTGTLAYVGEEPEVSVVGSGRGIVLWGAERLDGSIHAGPGWDIGSLRRYEFATGDVETHTFTKSGDYAADGPDAPFWAAWSFDDHLRPPAGTWRIYALARYGGPGAETDNRLVAEVEISVVGDADMSARDWGPLAVLPGGGAGDAGRGPGVLSIGEHCVTFKADGGEVAVMPIWPADRTTWHPQDRRIVMEQRRYGTTRLSDGDRVMLGGVSLMGDSVQEATRIRAWLDASWVQAPDPSCPTEDLFHVGEVEVLERP
jgi:hypothetical protein